MLPLEKGVEHLYDTLSEVSDVPDPKHLLEVLVLDDVAQEPETLLEWLRGHTEPLGVVFIHQPLWSLDALKAFRMAAEGLASHLIVTHQMYPETISDDGYYQWAGETLRSEPKHLLIKVKGE